MLDAENHPMVESTAELLNAVLRLPPQERLQLADALWLSIDEPDALPTVDDELGKLVQQRCEELDSGQVTPVTHDDVMARLDEALARCSSATTPPSPTN